MLLDLPATADFLTLDQHDRSAELRQVEGTLAEVPPARTPGAHGRVVPRPG